MGEQWFRHKWLEAIYESDLDPTARHVAEIFAGKARADSVVWEPLSNLQKKTGRGRKSIVDARARIIAGGWMTEIQAATNTRAAHFLLVIPDSAGGSMSEPQEVSGGSMSEPRGFDERTSGGSMSEPSQSFVNPYQSSLSPEQALVKDLLGLDDERDEMLMKIPKVLQDNKVRNPKVWLRRCHENGDLLRLLQAETETAGWGKPEDDGLMTNPNPPPEGWGIPKKRVPVESVFRPQFERIGLTEEQITEYVTTAEEIYPDGTKEQVWKEAYMTACNDQQNYPEEKTA